MDDNKTLLKQLPTEYFDFLFKKDLRQDPRVSHLMKEKYSFSVGKLYREKLNEYVELHHILPRFLGGSEHTRNYAVLRPSDHLIAHIILANALGGSHWRAAKKTADSIDNNYRNQDQKFVSLVTKLYRDLEYNSLNYKNKSLLKQIHIDAETETETETEAENKNSFLKWLFTGVMSSLVTVFYLQS